MSKEKKWENSSLAFSGFPICHDLTSIDADVGIIGIPYLTLQPYGPLPFGPNTSNPALATFGDQSLGPHSIRKMSQRFGPFLKNYDFDLKSEIFSDGSLRIVDCGDVDQSSPNDELNRKRAEASVRELLNHNVIPIVLGGDHATTISILRAYEHHGPICVIQIDAHLDYRNELGGVHEGLSSPMRRASEMPWVQSIVQIGLRGIGSATAEDVGDAISNGNILLRAEDLHRDGVDMAIQKIPKAKNYYITVDTDGLDPSIAPEVGAPVPGGLSFYQTVSIMRALTSVGHIVGADFVELAVEPDTNGKTAHLLGRLIIVLLGLISTSIRATQ